MRLVTPISTTLGRRLQIELQDSQIAGSPDIVINEHDSMAALVLFNTVDRDGWQAECDDIELILTKQMGINTIKVKADQLMPVSLYFI